MWFCILLLTVLVVLAGCKPEDAPAALRLVRTLVVDPKSIRQDRDVIGEVKPRYESDLSFLVDVGVSVNQGDTLATLDTQDYRNRLRSVEADVRPAEASLIEAQGAEGRQAKLLKDGWATRATYDTVLRNLRTAEAKLAAARANLDLTRDQPNYTELKADFDGVITAVGAEPGQNVNAGQMVVKPIFAAERPVLNRMLTIDVVQSAHRPRGAIRAQCQRLTGSLVAKMAAMMPEQSKMHFT